MNTQQEGGQQTKERDLGETSAAIVLISDFQPSGLRESTFLVFEPPQSAVFCGGSRSHLTHMAKGAAHN